MADDLDESVAPTKPAKAKTRLRKMSAGDDPRDSFRGVDDPGDRALIQERPLPPDRNTYDPMDIMRVRTSTPPDEDA